VQILTEAEFMALVEKKAAAASKVSKPASKSAPMAISTGEVDNKGPLNGKTVVFTGELAGLSREEAEHAVKSYGGKVLHADGVVEIGGFEEWVEVTW